MEYGDCTKRSAQAHARLVENFKVNEDHRLIGKTTIDLFLYIQQQTKELTLKQQIGVYKELRKSLKDSKQLLEIVEQGSQDEEDHQEG
jgi:hypothetical protein